MKSKRIVVKTRSSCKIRKRRDKIRWRELEDQHRSGGQITSHERDSTRIMVEQKGVHDLSNYHDCRSLVLMEVEKVLEDLSQNGEFAFGSFWGREESSSLSPDIAEQEFDNIVHCQLIEIINSFKNV